MTFCNCIPNSKTYRIQLVRLKNQLFLMPVIHLIPLNQAKTANYKRTALQGPQHLRSIHSSSSLARQRHKAPEPCCRHNQACKHRGIFSYRFPTYRIHMTITHYANTTFISQDNRYFKQFLKTSRTQ